MRIKKNKGFTLIELVMVIVILGILAAIAIPRFVSLTDEANEAACYANLGAIRSACAMYYAREAAQGRPAAFPTSYAVTGMYADGKTPVCPTNGTYTYTASVGTITCGNHP